MFGWVKHAAPMPMLGGAVAAAHFARFIICPFQLYQLIKICSFNLIWTLVCDVIFLGHFLKSGNSGITSSQIQTIG